MSVKIVEVDVDNEGRRLDNYLISYLKDIPKSKIYKIIRKGEIRVNSSRAKPVSYTHLTLPTMELV